MNREEKKKQIRGEKEMDKDQNSGIDDSGDIYKGWDYSHLPIPICQLLCPDSGRMKIDDVKHNTDCFVWDEVEEKYRFVL